MTRRVATPRRAGITFIEISLATLILALALLPVVGLIQGGLVRTDVSVSYSAATELGSAVMNKLLGDSLRFEDIPATPAGSYLAPDGSVAFESSLDPVFDDADWQTEEKARARTKDNIRYKVELWVGNFRGDTDLRFSYLENPNVDFTQASPYNRYNPRLKLAADDWPFSPYNPAQKPTDHLDKNRPGSAWSTQISSYTQYEVMGRLGTSTGSNSNQTLKKLVLRVSWSGKPTGRHGLGDATKEFWLISLRANLGGN